MFWKVFKAKGKLRLCGLFALCAVLLGCAIFAFAGIFGGKSFFKNENNSQDGNSIIANAAISGSGTSSSPYVLSGTCAEIASGWTRAYNESSASKTIYVKLGSNWTAASGNFGSGTGFYGGSIYVGSGKNINFNLGGFTINRGLTAQKSDGYVILTHGKLTISNGTITGGNCLYDGGGILAINSGSVLTMNSGLTIKNNTAQWGGGVGVFNGAIATMNSGVTISGNTAIENGGGVKVYGRDGNAYFTMNGGTITGNKAVSRVGVNV